MFFLVKLKFKRAVSFGNYSLLDHDHPWGMIHSDTLFSAILNHWVKADRSIDVLKLITELDSDDPPFLMSSAFPFSDTAYYLPTPRGTSEIYSELLKDFPYLELSHFASLASGETEPLWRLGHEIPGRDLVSHDVAPRVTIDRVSNATNLFQIENWTMPFNSGLYFILDLRDESLKPALELSIKLLGEAGVGADRSTGHGIFDCVFDDVSDDPTWCRFLRTKTAHDLSYCALSLCCPAVSPSTGKSEASEAKSYRIISRSGWISSSSSWMQGKRRECRMFAEGSLFTTPVKGCIAEVTPSIFEGEHRIYRYGLGLIVGGAW